MDPETQHIVVPTESTAHVLSEIDATLDSLDQLARTVSDETQFYDQLLCLAAAPIHAEAGAAWRPGPMGKLDRTAVLDAEFLQADAFRAEEKRLACLKTSVMEVIPNGRSTSGTLSTTVTLGDDIRRILVFYLDSELPDAAHTGYLQYVDAVAEIATQFEQQSDRRQLMQSAGELRSFERLTLAVHRDWDLPKTCYAIANEGRTFLECDRLSAAVRIGRQFELLAVSGVDVVDRRSRAISTLETLIEAVAKTGETLIYDGDASRLPQQIAVPLREHVDVAAVKSIVIVPIKRSCSGEEELCPFVALVAEYFSTKPSGRFLAKLSSLSEQTALSVGRAVQLRRAPLARAAVAVGCVWRKLGWHTGSRWGIAALCGAAILIALWFLPAKFFVTVRGEVQPVSTKGIFASADGVVEAVQVHEGSSVSRGQLIASLTSKELELELQRVSGNLATATERLRAIDAERLQARSGSAGTRRETSRLSASELTLKSELVSLQKQLRILQQQEAELELRSPISGRILSEDVEMLLARPVQRGQRLLEVAELDGPWMLKFELPDRPSGHVLRALREQPHGLAIRFVLANRPENEYLGKTSRVAFDTRTDAGGSPVLPLEGTFDRELAGQLRPGASVVGKIDCGTRSLGFVWFHELLEELRRRFF